jgi:hypothetical protein
MQAVAAKLPPGDDPDHRSRFVSAAFRPSAGCPRNNRSKELIASTAIIQGMQILPPLFALSLTLVFSLTAGATPPERPSSLQPVDDKLRNGSTSRTTDPLFPDQQTDLAEEFLAEAIEPASPGNANQTFAADNGAKADKHQKREIEGWTVLISPLLLEKERDLTEHAMELLTVQLREITRVVPASAVQELRKVPLWFSPPYPNAGQRAEYHPGAGWLRDNGRDPVMDKAVEFTNVSIFER